MNNKLIAALSVMAILAGAFCFMAVVPVEEADAVEQATKSLGQNNPVGEQIQTSYTFTGGRWNDTVESGPSVISTTNCTAIAFYERSGSPSNWQWTLGVKVTPSSAGPFSCTVYMKTKGGFLAPSDEYQLAVSGTAVNPTPQTVTVTAGPMVAGSGTATITSGGQSSTSSMTVPLGASVTITANVDPDYTFTGWLYTVGQQFPQTTSASTLTLTATADINAQFGVELDITLFQFRPDNYSYGSVSSGMEVLDGRNAYVRASGSTLVISSGSDVRYITASPASSTAQYNYIFDGWYNPNDQQVPSYDVSTGGGMFTAKFHREIRNYTVTVIPNDPSYGTVNGSSSASYSVPYGTSMSTAGSTLSIGSNTVTAVANPPTDEYSYSFATWSNVSATVTGPSTITANFIRSTEDYVVDFVASPSYGSFQPVDSLIAPYGSEITVNGSMITINGVDVTAVPNASDGIYTYSFDSWSIPDDAETVTEDITITAVFTRSSAASIVHWANGYQNGKVSMVFNWPSEDTEIHNMAMELYSGTANPDQTTTWSPNGFVLNISLSYPTTNFSFDLQLNGTSVLTKTATAGKWAQYELTMDFTNGQVYMIPLRTFTSFVEYETLDSQKQVLFDFGSSVRNSTIMQIDHEDTGSGDHVRFSVTDTDVFLNTYGIVMNSPTINIYNHFPQYDQVRVNFYAFALYGSAITINGVPFVVDGSDITIRYATTSDGKHVLPSMLPGGLVDSRTFALTNISVTWNGTNCLLTFENDRFTIDLGTYTPGNETVSFTGIWYFTSVLYEPHESTQKELGEWKMLPDIGKDAMLIIFLGLIVLVGAAAVIKFNGSMIDLLIIGGAAVVAFFLIG